MRRRSWVHGDKTRLAKGAGISPQYLSDLLSGRRDCRGKLATTLAEEAMKMGYHMPREQWVFLALRSTNPLFPRI